MQFLFSPLYPGFDVVLVRTWCHSMLVGDHVVSTTDRGDQRHKIVRARQVIPDVG